MNHSSNNIDAKFWELERKLDVGFANLREMIGAIRAENEAARDRAKMLRWSLLIMLLGGITGAANAWLSSLHR